MATAACNKEVELSPGPMLNELTISSPRIWKLYQYTDNYTIYIEDTIVVSGMAQTDFGYYCQRPIQKLASRHIRCEEMGESYLESDRTYTYNDNFEITQIHESNADQVTTTNMLRDEDNKFIGIEHTHADGTTVKPQILQNKHGQVICYFNDWIRYDYFWKNVLIILNLVLI